MEIRNFKEIEEKTITKFPYRGTTLEVKGVTLRWLSQAGADPSNPDYGLRLFRVAPMGEIPIHSHFYVQTMYMLTGELVVRAHDRESDAVTSERKIGPHDYVFVPSMEPHSMVNRSVSTEATFLCCIANVLDAEDA